MARLLKVLVLLTALGAWLGAGLGQAAAEEAKKPPLEESLKKAETYKFGESRLPLTEVSEAITAANPEERKAISVRLAAFLTSATATLDAKQFACRELSVIGGAAQVPPLAALLADKDLSDYARYALERIPDAAAGAALRDALGKAEGRTKVGVINSLGQRRDAAAVGALKGLLSNPDEAIAGAAAAALGKIGGKDAAGALGALVPKAPEKVRPVATDAYLLCADQFLKQNQRPDAEKIYKELYAQEQPRTVRIAALCGLAAAQGEKALPVLQPLMTGDDTEMRNIAFRLVQKMPGTDATKAIAAMVPKLPAASQAMLIEQLAERRDPAAAPAVLEAAKSEDEGVRSAAYRALGSVGDASTVPMLTKAAVAGGPQQSAAREALGILRGKEIDPALLAQMNGADAATRVVLIQTLAARRSEAAVPVLEKGLGDEDASIRRESATALGALGQAQAVAPLVALLTKTDKDDERQAAEKAVLAVCDRVDDKAKCGAPVLAALGGAKGPAKAALVRTLIKVADPKALAAVRGALGDADAGVQDAALRTLADWPDAAAAAPLLEIAKTSDNANRQILALRGYIRLANSVKMYEEAMGLAKRPEEKKMVLGALANQNSLEALKLAEPCLADDALKEEASQAVVRIAQRLDDNGKKAAKDALEKVVQVSKNGDLLNDAKGLLEHIKKISGQAGAPARSTVIFAAPRLSPGEAAAQKLGWRLALQAWSFNKFTFFEAVDKCKALGIRYIEAFPGQKISKDGPEGGFDQNMSDETMAAVKKKLQEAGVQLVKFGVCGVPGDEAGARKMFEWARKMGIETLNTEAGEDQLKKLDPLCQEYKINVSLHNHPKESHYWNPDAVLKAVEGLSKCVGADADTGHWVRSGLVPIECLKKLQGRIISLHFKDVKGGADVPWGEGDSDARGQLAELKRQGFKGVLAIEYESAIDEDMSQIAKCVAFFNQVAEELAAGKAK